jgi:DNA-binding MarR family transcriptional regulator
METNALRATLEGPLGARRLLSQEQADDLLKAILVAVRTAHHVLERRTIEIAKEPLTRSKVQILRLLGQQGDQSPSQIAPYLGVSKPAVTQIVSSMVKSRLIERATRSRDRRRFKLKLTPRGHHILEEVRAQQRHLVLSAFSRSKGKHRPTWADTLTEISIALAHADDTFEKYCHRCGAHEEGSCVLVGGNADCLYLDSQRRARQKKKPRIERAPRSRR